ncbi:hypothetical protein AVEN_185591-1 [Araneus ventricosus]|uniref:Uncharacterized protein n=1 Tax=Araneus ventricosus TaxID=182803 RepID=A0A4Y2UVZ3_ARAVE|nr:hypothetical protein AVEN_185591-1 [Araneus ventricosus]
MKLSHVRIILNAFIKIGKIPDGKPERKGRFRLSGNKKLDIHAGSAPVHLDLFAKDGSNFQFVPLCETFKTVSKRTIGFCDPRLLPSSKQDARSLPTRLVFVSVGEDRASSRGSYFSLMTECATTLDFQIFDHNSHRIFALTTGFGAKGSKWN